VASYQADLRKIEGGLSRCTCNGEVLPPVGFALALPVSRHRCNHFTAELGLRLKFSAASRREAPASTASITRSRKSSEYGFGIAWAPKDESAALDSPTDEPMGIPSIQVSRNML
jgi:hypothetical protein